MSVGFKQVGEGKEKRFVVEKKVLLLNEKEGALRKSG